MYKCIFILNRCSIVCFKYKIDQNYKNTWCILNTPIRLTWWPTLDLENFREKVFDFELRKFLTNPRDLEKFSQKSKVEKILHNILLYNNILYNSIWHTKYHIYTQTQTYYIMLFDTWNFTHTHTHTYIHTYKNAIEKFAVHIYIYIYACPFANL